MPAPAATGRRANMSPAGRMTDAVARSVLARSRLVHGLVKSRAGQFAIQTTRGARQVRRPVRFVAAQVLSRRSGTHRLRESDLLVEVRHGTPDVIILNEIYRERIYRLPSEAMARLQALGRPPAALDLGGHIGLFGTWFFGAFPAGRLTTLEPDPANAAVIRRTIHRNGLGPRWTLLEACASDADGETDFVAGDFCHSRIPVGDESGTIRAATRDAFALAAAADLVKIDIEGGEWRLLADARFTCLSAPVLAMEWHANGAPVAADRARHAALNALSDAGYRVQETGPSDPLAGTVWAWR